MAAEIIVYAVLAMITAGIFTYVDHKFPSVRMPYLYQENMFLNYLANLLFFGTVGAATWFLLP